VFQPMTTVSNRDPGAVMPMASRMTAGSVSGKSRTIMSMWSPSAGNADQSPSGAAMRPSSEVAT
jgi:hypothetical protein